MTRPATEPERASLEPDGKLHRLNRAAHRVARCAVAVKRAAEDVRHGHWFWKPQKLRRLSFAEQRFNDAVAAYERLVGEGETDG